MATCSGLDGGNKALVLASIYLICPQFTSLNNIIHTHTCAVPLVLHNPGDRKYRQLSHDPGLSDVAPTVLDLMGLDIPKEMSGQSLLVKK